MSITSLIYKANYNLILNNKKPASVTIIGWQSVAIKLDVKGLSVSSESIELTNSAYEVPRVRGKDHFQAIPRAVMQHA